MTRFATLATRVPMADTRRVTPPAKVVDRFYTSAEWRQLVAQIIRQRGRRCEECGRTSTPGGRVLRVFGDHLIELQDGGAPLDPNNVRLKCGSCHTKKTLAERARRLGAPAVVA
jgi:5-methylcytosine-specific restriction endonuclease McrA